MSKDSIIKADAIITEALGNAMFKAELVNNGSIILCHISGKMRMNYIKIMTGDTVEVELSVYDLTKGKIIKRK